MSEVAIPEPHQVATESAGTQALQNLSLQAQAMGNAMQIAEAMCSTQMVPKAFQGKPADGAAAILYGAELGLNAIQSLQQIMVINGKPGIETRTAVALLMRHGYVIRTVESSDTSVTVEGVAPSGHTEQSTWDIDRAKLAGYTKNALYERIPQQMLYAKAAMEVARKIAPHVLMGIAYSTEELHLENGVPAPVRATARRMDKPRGVAGVKAALAKPKQESEQPAPVLDVDSYLAAIKGASTLDELNQIAESLKQHGSAPGIDEVRTAWMSRQDQIQLHESFESELG